MSADDDPGAATELTTVRILGLPLQLHARAQQQSEGMRREFSLIVEQSRDEVDAVPSRLLQLSMVLSQRYEGFNAAQEELIQSGIEAGDLQLDEVVFTLPSHAGRRPRSSAGSSTRPTCSAGRASC